MIDLFAVGVRLSMTGNSAQALGEMLRLLGGVEISQKLINANFQRMAVIGAAGFAALGIAAAIKGMWEIVKASGKLNDELVRTKQLGGEFATPAAIARARSQAFATARDVPTFAPSDLVKVQRELGSQLAHPDLAASSLTMAASAAMVASNYTGEDQEKVLKNLIKVADLRAQIFSIGADGKEHADPARLAAELDAAVKSLILTAGYMDSTKLLSLATTGGLPAKGMTPEAFYAAAAELAVSQGGARAGTELTSLMSQFRGGVMTQKIARNLVTAGAMMPGDWSPQKGGGGGVVLSPKGLARFNSMDADPVAWMEGPGKTLVENYAKKQNISLVAAVFQLFGRQTTARAMGEALKAGPQFERAREFFHTIPDLQQQLELVKGESFGNNLEGLGNAIKGFEESVGTAGVPGAISLMRDLTDAIHGLTSLTEAHPGVTIEFLKTIGSSLDAATGGLWNFMSTIRDLVKLLSGLSLPNWLGGGGGLPGPNLPNFNSPNSPVGRGNAPWSGRTYGPNGNSNSDGSLKADPNAPPSGHGYERLGSVYLDGAKVGYILENHLADRLSRGQSGANSPDIRVGALMPGAVGNWALG